VFHLIPAATVRPVRHGDFNIDIYRPGEGVPGRGQDRGVAQLGRFDRGRLSPGVLVKMHPHRDDEILSYVRAGAMTHEDSAGSREVVTPTRLMLMNAGTEFRHQESIPSGGEPVEILQIFLRPERASLPPRVQFHDFPEAHSVGAWRLIAGPEDENPPLVVRSQASVYDARLTDGAEIAPVCRPGRTYLLYAFAGSVVVAPFAVSLATGDALLLADEPDARVTSAGVSDLVLFELDEAAPYTLAGMFSGA
jgi:quercetin 2,3-dioxygenase